MAPPTAGFNPYAAGDRALESAFLWMTVAGVVPLDAARHDGGLELREDMLEALALRTPGLGEQLIESYATDPALQRVLLERELFRLGQPMCSATATNEELIVRRAELLRQQHEMVNAPDPAQRTIGLDGRQSTLQAAIDYELEQRILAMNPGSVAGTYYASLVAVRGGSIEEIRAAGAAGNAFEGVAGALGGVDPSKLGRRTPPGIIGRRRAPPGPGLGRRTRVAQGRVRIPVRTPAVATHAGAAERANPTAIGTRTPVAFDDKHVLTGEVKLTPGGTPRAVGFHHQAPGTEGSARIVPGTESKQNKLGVYRGVVEIKDPRTGQWVRKNAESTFFPKHWTRSEVRTAILEAFANRTETAGGRWEGKLSNGMRITGAVDQNGRITTAYPEFERD